MSVFFFVFLLLPTLALAFVMLATFYGFSRAYLALCWVPVTLFGLIYLFQNSLFFQNSPSSWPGYIFLALGWTSLLQAGLGLVLAGRAYHRKKSFVGIAIATCLVLIPFIFKG